MCKCSENGIEYEHNFPTSSLYLPDENIIKRNNWLLKPDLRNSDYFKGPATNAPDVQKDLVDSINLVFPE